MAKMFHKRSPSFEGQKVFLATPAYSGTGAGYVYAMFASSVALYKAGIAAELAIFAEDCHVDDSRNRLVRDFLETDCTDLVFLDSDLMWKPDDLVKLCKYDRDVVAVTYLLKQEEEAFPIRFLGDEVWSDRDGLTEVDGVPTGFLRIKRHVLKTLAEKAVRFAPKSDKRSYIPVIFERQVHDGARRGGDYAFCRKWRDLGGKIFVDAEMILEHSGSRVWRGSLGSFVRRENKLSLPYCLKAIKEGRDTPDTYAELALAWGNPLFSAPNGLLWTASILARKATEPILECGSGMTTLVMAVANPNVTIHCLEDDPVWADKVSRELESNEIENVTIHLCGFKDYPTGRWYDSVGVLPSKFSMVLIDGPCRDKGNRGIIFDQLSDQLANANVLVDDMNDPSTMAAFHKWAKSEGREINVIGNEGRFAISVPSKVLV